MLAWHHTDLARAAFIMMDGAIRPSRINPHACKCLLPPDAAAVVWLTGNHRGDPTAAASPRPGSPANGRLPPPVRFGAPWEATLAPDDLIGAHGWTWERTQENARKGMMLGADPRQWRVAVGQLPVADLVRQVKVRQQWRDLRPIDIDIVPFALGIRVRCYGIDMAVALIKTEDGRTGYAIQFDPDPPAGRVAAWQD